MAELKPIHNRQQTPLLSETEAMRVEWGRTTFAEIGQEQNARLRIENQMQRDRIERLEAENATLSATVETLASQSLRDRERLIVAGKAHTLWLGGLAVATLAAVIVALSIIR